MNAEKEKVISVLRSIIISNPLKGSTLRELIRDYCDIEGKREIPKFDHQSIEDFLRASGEFFLEKRQGELMIYEKPKLDSLHIHKLVSEQNKPKKRRSIASKPKRFIDRPQTQFIKTAANYHVPKSASKNYAPRRFGNNITNNNQRGPPNQFQRSSSVQNRISSNITSPSSIQSFDLRNKINARKTDNLQKAQQVCDAKIAPDRSSNLIEKSMSPTLEQPKIVKPDIPLLSQSMVVSSMVKTTITSKLQNRLNPAFVPMKGVAPIISTVQQQQPQHQAYNIQMSIAQPKPQLQVSMQPKSQLFNSMSEQNRLSSPLNNSPFQIQALFDYCKKNNLSEPEFKLFMVKGVNRFQCRVMINNVVYSTYPMDYENEAVARYETAKHALEHLQTAENRITYPICLDSEVGLAFKIHALLKACTSGVFYTKLPDLFQNTYQESLPPEWERCIVNYPQFFTIDDCLNNRIVHAAQDIPTKVVEDENEKMDKLILPWNETYWSLEVTNIVSTSEIWARIIGKEYNEAMQSMITDIEIMLMSEKRVPQEYIVGDIYLILMSECCYRVRIQKVDNSRTQCLCFLIDDGDQRWFQMNEIYVCPKKFLKFPPQTIRFSLYGLDDFDENDFAKAHLEEILPMYQGLVGHIQTKREEYISQDESDDMEPLIQVVFYDTSTADDINLNKLIVQKICADIPIPTLPTSSKFVPVYISHISENGDIFCQLQQNDVHYVNKLIHKLTQADISYGAEIKLNENAEKKLLLVFDEDTKKWCRCTFANEGGSKNNQLFFVDNGKTKCVPLTQIYQLESLSHALSKFPPQAIKTKLYDVDEISKSVVSLLRGHFSPDTLAYVKVMANSLVPEINLYLSKGSQISCINDLITWEKEFNQVTDDFSMPSLIRQLSMTSNSSSHESKTPESPINQRSVYLGNLTKLCPFTPPKVDSYFEIEVVMASNPFNFVIRSNRDMPQWVLEMKKLQEYCKSATETIHINMLETGQVYACLHSDRNWYRGVILHCEAKIIVSFVDLGEVDTIDDIKKIKILPEMYRKLPKLAIHAKLYGIRPIHSDWDLEDCIFFNRLTVSKKFQSIVRKITPSENLNDNSILELSVIDVSSDEDVCINDVFVQDGRAYRI